MTPALKRTPPSAFVRAFIRVTSAVDRAVGWHRLPRPFGILTLIGIRDRLREENLFDAGTVAPKGEPPAPNEARPDLGARTLDGTYNDLDEPRMGSIGCRFGRNVPLASTFPEPDAELLDPSPRLVSRTLMTRDRFIPAETLNLLAAAWIQFEVHDWFSHGKNQPEHPWEVPVEAADPWPQHPMLVDRTRPDPTRTAADRDAPTFTTDDTHWWDASQIYGNEPAFAARVREHAGGRLRVENGLPPRDLQELVDLAGPGGNLWLGLALLHTLFTLEHNAVCAALAEAHPTWTDEQLFQCARLVNAALMAKIHTVEWTPAIIAHPTTRWGMRINWWGLVGERLTKRFGRLSPNEVVSGIPGSPKDHHGVPYSLTEEFVAVYRMHPLIPDDFTFWSADTGAELATHSLPDLGVLHVGERLDELGVANSLYSFGVSHPGAITLHNYPRHLQRFEKPTRLPTPGAPATYDTIDLAAIDVLRNRERGVPRYNEFRRRFHLKPAERFEHLTDDPVWARELRDVYRGDVERVDLMAGLYAEPRPPGFGFSDTAFRVFVLMASRRLKSDRFFTTDYTPATYSPVGMRWIDDNSLATVILRHYPDLAPAIRQDNAFLPWARSGG